MPEDESIKQFIACKRRNVAAAYARFLGPSAGALPEPWHSRTWAGLVHALVVRRRKNLPPSVPPAELAESAESAESAG